MSEASTDQQLDGFLEIRKPGAHLHDEVVADDFVLDVGRRPDELPEVRTRRRWRHLCQGHERRPPGARRRLRR